MSDPMEESAFKPSPTKPIPTWMQPFQQMTPPSSQRRQAIGTPHTLVAYSQTPATSTSRGSMISTGRSLSPTPQPTRKPRYSSPSRSSLNSLPAWPPPETRRTQPTWVSHEPLKRPSSRLVARLEKSEATVSSGYATPPKTPPEKSPGYQTPPPQLRRVRPQSPLATMGARRRNAVRRSPPPQSSEYLERYNPIRSPSPSPAPRPGATEPAKAVFERTACAEASLGITRETAERNGGKLQEDRGSLAGDGADSPRGELGRKNFAALRRLFGGKEERGRVF